MKSKTAHSRFFYIQIGAKAQHRLGTVNFYLQRPVDAVQAFAKALELEPRTKQYADDLKRAKSMIPLKQDAVIIAGMEDHPAGRITRLVADYKAGRIAENPVPPLSAAQRVLSAYKEFETAIKLLRQFPPSDTRSSSPSSAIVVESGTVRYLADGFISDMRACFFENEDLERIQTAIEVEEEYYKVTSLSGQSVSNVVKKFKRRLETEGWTSVRDAFAVVVRSLIILGCENRLIGKLGDAIKILGKAVALIKAARAELDPHDQHILERGVCMHNGYLRAAQVLLMNTIMQGYWSNQDKAAFPLEDVKSIADELVNSCETDPSLNQTYAHDRNLDEVNFVRFHLMPLASGYMGLAYYHGRMAMKKAEVGKNGIYLGTDPIEFQLSAGYYVKAASLMPDDEQERSVALYKAMEYFIKGGGPSKVTLWELKDAAEKSRKKAEAIFGKFMIDQEMFIDGALKKMGEPKTDKEKQAKLKPGTFVGLDINAQEGKVSIAPPDKNPKGKSKKDVLTEEEERKLAEQVQDLKLSFSTWLASSSLLPRKETPSLPNRW